MADLDLSGRSYTFSVVNGYFYGTFDGNGHKISNMTIDSTASNTGLALFMSIYGTVKNLTLENPYVRAKGVSARAGGITTSYGGGTYIIENCHVINADLYTANQYAGGIDAFQYYADCRIINCTCTGTITHPYGTGNGIIGDKGHSTDLSITLQGSSFTGYYRGNYTEISF